MLVRALRRSFRHVDRFTPRIASGIAELLFRTPPRCRRLPREERVLEEGTFSRTPFDSRSLPTWTWGRGPAVLLVHGWGGHAGRLASFVGPLVRAGYRVVAFDAPGHGSAPGRHSGLPEFVDAIRAVTRSHGPFEALVGHSLGATAGALAARDGLRVPRLVLLAPPADPEKYWGRFARYFRMPPRTRDAMTARLERRYRTSWAQLRVAGGACRAQVIVFQDRRDRTVPLADGLEIVRSWANARLVRTRGLGHHRILRDPTVIARTVSFVAGRVRIRLAARAPRVPRLRPAPAS